MKRRTLALYQSMRQAAAVVHSFPELRARADESKAFELFVAVIADFEALQREQASSPLELKQLAARKNLLTGDIRLAIDAVITTASLIPRTVPLPPFSTPRPDLTTFIFCVKARGLIDAAADFAPVFIENGLHPRTFDDARAWITQLVDVDLQERVTMVYAESFNDRLDMTIDTARKRRHQLDLDLRRAITTTESGAAWRTAYKLGRSHRPKQLPAAPEQKLLGAPQSDDRDESAQQAEPGDGGIKRLVRRVGRHLAGTETA